MRFLRVSMVLVLALLFAVSVQAETKNKKYSKEEIKKALVRAMRIASLSPGSLKCLATIDIKKDEEGLVKLAGDLGLEIKFYGAASLNKMKCATPPSRFVEKITGSGGVAEPAALLASGADRLCLKKIKSPQVTVALAKAPFTS